MEAKELRYHNLVINKNGNLDLVAGFFGDKVYLANSGESNILDIKPIPITEEWLVKAGFERVKAREGINSSYKFKGVRINVSNSFNCYHKDRPVVFVHRLQNLILALTGEELTFKL